jgi:hypothetical protein
MKMMKSARMQMKMTMLLLNERRTRRLHLTTQSRVMTMQIQTRHVTRNWRPMNAKPMIFHAALHRRRRQHCDRDDHRGHPDRETPSAPSHRLSRCVPVLQLVLVVQEHRRCLGNPAVHRDQALRANLAPQRGHQALRRALAAAIKRDMAAHRRGLAALGDQERD